MQHRRCMPTATNPRNLFDAIGGAPAVAAATDALYERILADPQLARHFDGVDVSELNRHMRAFLASALGGAGLYQGRDMGTAHARLQITEADWDAVVDHLVGVLQSLNVPADLIGEIGARVLPLKVDIVTA